MIGLVLKILVGSFISFYFVEIIYHSVSKYSKFYVSPLEILIDVLGNLYLFCGYAILMAIIIYCG